MTNLSHDSGPFPGVRFGEMNAVLPPEVARALGLSKPGDSAMIEVTGTQADGGVTVMVEAESESEAPAPVPQAPAGPAAPPELMAALGM